MPEEVLSFVTASCDLPTPRVCPTSLATNCEAGVKGVVVAADEEDLMPHRCQIMSSERSRVELLHDHALTRVCRYDFGGPIRLI